MSDFVRDRTFREMTTSVASAECRLTMSAADIGDRGIELVIEVLQSGVLSIGSMVRRFEALVAARVGARHAVAVSSGTAGLHVCLVAAGIGPGDEVVTSPFSFVAPANAVQYAGAHPVFADIEPDTLNIDPNLIERAITTRTKAILPVHVFGQPANLDAIRDIARRHHLIVIEDACEAIGAEHCGRCAGTLGDAGVFAFYPNKQITTAEGGVIVTDDDGLAALCRSLRNHGRDHMDGHHLHHSRLGYNYRLSELHAAVGVAQMERFDDLLERRARVASSYRRHLKEVDGVHPPTEATAPTRQSWFAYVVRLDHGMNRDVVMRSLEENGIPSRDYFPPIHLQPHYRRAFGHRAGDFPVTEREAARTLALPFHGHLDEADIQRVCETLDRCVRSLA